MELLPVFHEVLAYGYVWACRVLPADIQPTAMLQFTGYPYNMTYDEAYLRVVMSSQRGYELVVDCVQMISM